MVGLRRIIQVVSSDASLGSSVAALSAKVRPLVDAPGGDLNGALRQGRDAAVAQGATAVLMLPADLPLLSAASLERLLDAADASLAAGNGRPMVAIAAADARGGTNALLLSPPDVIEPHFGNASFEAHLRAAAARRRQRPGARRRSCSASTSIRPTTSSA